MESRDQQNESDDPAERRQTRPAVSNGPDQYRDRRQHTVSQLPVMDPERKPPEHYEVLLSVYGEICANWRMLTDVRFKLLALLPPVAAIALIGVVSVQGPFKDLNHSVRVALALFGFLVTLGLYVYDKRNNTLYDDLVSRARRAEYDLGVHTGAFIGRVKPKQGRLGMGLVQHHVATRLVYWTVLLSWVAAMLFVIFIL